ncbi:nucleoporin-62 C-terminal-like protein isoform X1 [Oryctolagus cuniculus]|uniref:nucleoporin-62 C-terminal-like protein isoform X1 n=1 Tax=Oryctolagus cuniculus TaxID=9986 RepID=UPI000390462F|nr:nucleoporin-62 C-terminal-like protein isoform X1 [Oryctolagus cuniculus]XP_008271072.1 nucleoporin-62 C-terminal-like protein isoform X1 [Oryctolagus cuniculus]XP_051683189.1 nucleoporin-62 C-terminal-like protein isoform X1 [Oryctolagus cuniculus]
MNRFNFGGTSIPTGLTPVSTVATTISNTMLFTSMSNTSTSTVATKLSSTTATTTTTTVTTTTTTIINSGFNKNLKPLASAWINTDPISVHSVPFTSTVNSIATPVMTYGDLEGLMNKWSLDLEEQEKQFLFQAMLVNAWDHILIENTEKIISLHGEVEKVKLAQKRLEQELDFILSEQKELEDVLTPLEKAVKKHREPVYLQHTEEEHERIYRLAENIDVQLKQMSQDLEDIINHLNAFGIPADTTDLEQCRGG